MCMQVFEILRREIGCKHSHSKLKCKLSINFNKNIKTLYTKHSCFFITFYQTWLIIKKEKLKTNKLTTKQLI